MCYGFETFVKISLSNEISHFLIYTSVSSSIYIRRGEFTSLAAIESFIQQTLIYWYCIMPWDRAFANYFISICGFYHIVLSVTSKFLSLARICPLIPIFYIQLPACHLHMGASQTQLNLSYWSPNLSSSSLILVESRAPPFNPPWLRSELRGLTQTRMTPRTKSKLCTHQHLPLQIAHTHGTGHLGRVRLESRLPVVWAGNSEVQKPGNSPQHSLLLAPAAAWRPVA